MRVVGIEVALADQIVDEALLIFRRQRQIELVLIDRLDQQLVDRADEVGLDLAQADLLVRQRAGGVALEVEVVGVGFVEEDLHRNAELAAVVQHAVVRVRNAPRADVDVLAFVERADLALAAELRCARALAHRPLQAADALARFEHLVVVAKLAEFVADDQAGHAAAENEDLGLRRLAAQARASGPRSPPSDPTTSSRS